MTRREDGKPSVPSSAHAPRAAVAAASRMSQRIAPRARPRLQRLDLMLVSAMLAVTVSYALGYRLDWRQEQGLFLGTAAEEEEETVGAQIPAPAATAPPMTAGGFPSATGGQGTSAPALPSPEGPALAPSPAPAQAAIVPAATAAWAQDGEQAEWDKMTEELARVAARHPGRVGIVLKDLRTQRTWSYHPDDLFPAASLIKVPVMIAAFYKISAGELSLRDRLMLRRATRVGGSGSLKWRPDGTRLTVEDLLVHMINESDNTATAMIIDALGLGYVQQQFPRMGLLYSGIYPEGMSIKGGRVAHENYTTAREMTMLLEKIYRGEAVDKYSSSVMLDILKKPKAVPSRLAKGLPVGWEIAHKTGLLRMACHDSAIFFTPQGDYAMTVLTGQNRNYQAAKDFISRLGHVTFRYYTGSDRLARRSSSRAQDSLSRAAATDSLFLTPAPGLGYRVWVRQRSLPAGFRLLLAVLTPSLAVAPAICQDENETPAIQRNLADLHLGDTLEAVQLIYPPAQEWPSQEERRVRVTRLRVERGTAKSFPPDAQVLWLGLRHGRLVDIQIIYDARFSRRRPAERLAQDLALVYGEAHRSNDKFWWTDGRTVLRVFDAELPARPGKERSVELRTSVQILERDLFHRGD